MSVVFYVKVVITVKYSAMLQSSVMDTRARALSLSLSRAILSKGIKWRCFRNLLAHYTSCTVPLCTRTHIVINRSARGVQEE